MYTCHTAIKVSPLAACPTAYPVQNSGHHAQGFVNFRSAVHLRTPTTPSDDAVSAVHRLSASLCAMDTHWDSQASVLYGGSERLEWHCRFRNASCCQRSMPNWKHTLLLHTVLVTNIPISASLHWLSVDIIGAIQIILHYMHVYNKKAMLSQGNRAMPL